MKNISKHITHREGIRSATATRRGLNNNPGETHLEAMKLVAKKIFEPVRTHFGEPIRINSFYRGKDLNRAIGGSKTSQHCKGEAIDVDGMNGITNAEIFHYIKDNLDFDQLIWEFGTDKEPDWVHFSYTGRRKNRKIVLRAHRSKPTYRSYE